MENVRKPWTFLWASFRNFSLEEKEFFAVRRSTVDQQKRRSVRQFLRRQRSSGFLRNSSWSRISNRNRTKFEGNSSEKSSSSAAENQNDFPERSAEKFAPQTTRRHSSKTKRKTNFFFPRTRKFLFFLRDERRSLRFFGKSSRFDVKLNRKILIDSFCFEQFFNLDRNSSRLFSDRTKR